MQNQILAFIDQANSFLSGYRDSAYDAIYRSTGELTGQSNALINQASAPINAALEHAASLYQGIVLALQNGITAPIEQIKAAIDGWTAEAVSTVNVVRDSTIQALADLDKAVVVPIDKTTTDVTNTHQSLVEKVINNVTHTIEHVTETLHDVNITMPDIGGAIVSGFAGALSPLVAPFMDPILSVGKGIGNIGSAVGMLGKLADLADLMHSPEDAVAAAKGLTKRDPGKPFEIADRAAVALMSVTGALIGAPLGFLPSVMDAYSAGMGEGIKNEARSLWHPSRMGMAELAAAFVRGNITAEKLFRNGSELGFSSGDVVEYIKLARLMLGSNELIALWLRGELSEPDLNTRLSELGLIPDDVERVKKLAYFIPQVNDLIHMAVREAFTPDIATKFGQYEDYPPALTQYANMQGLSEEWAKRYWAAHWELPSAGQGFEMYQRKIIDKPTLELLLRALDVMPFWRDQLIKMAYQPITRVDIRRMHKMHLITDADLQLRYEAIGYSPEDAAMLVQFTIALNTEEAKAEKQVTRDLTKSEILSAYANAMIAPDSTIGMLSDLGYDDNEIALEMVLAELPALKKVRDKRIAIINQRLMYGRITLNGAVDELNKMDLAPAEMDYILADFQLDLELQQFKTEAKSAK